MANKLNFKITKFKELTESQWQFIKPFITTQRKIKKDLRSIVNAILFITRTGVQCGVPPRRNLDIKYGAWESVYYYFRKWKKSGILENILIQLVHKQRVILGRNAQATACAIDSQSIKVVPLTKNDKGIDGNKLVNGRKRHIIVDTLGLPIAIFVGAANISDGIAGLELLAEITKTTKILRIIRGDNAYKGSFKVAASYFGYEVEVKQRPETSKGFVPETGRWQVERRGAAQSLLGFLFIGD